MREIRGVKNPNTALKIALDALKWIAEDAVYKAPEQHNWLSQRYARKATAALDDIGRMEDA